MSLDLHPREGEGGGGDKLLEEARYDADDAAPLGRDVRIVVSPVALGHHDEAAVPHERPVLRPRADVDPAAQDKAVGDAIARWYWRVVTVTEW